MNLLTAIGIICGIVGVALIVVGQMKKEPTLIVDPGLDTGMPTVDNDEYWRLATENKKLLDRKRDIAERRNKMLRERMDHGVMFTTEEFEKEMPEASEIYSKVNDNLTKMEGLLRRNKIAHD